MLFRLAFLAPPFFVCFVYLAAPLFPDSQSLINSVHSVHFVVHHDSCCLFLRLARYFSLHLYN